MKLLRSMVVAALPAGLGAAALAALWRTELRFQANCEPVMFGDCLSWRLPVLLFGPPVLVVLIWLVLWAARVDRALPVALLGAIVTADATLLYEAGQPRWSPPPVWLAALLGALGLVAGLIVATCRLPLAAQVVLAAVLLLIPGVLFPVLHQLSRRADQEATLARIGVPLLVARVEGYQVLTAHADQRHQMLTVVLRKGDNTISIVVTPRPAGFAPPVRCGPTAAEINRRQFDVDPAAAPPCRPIGPDHWVRAEPNGQVHLLLRDGALVQVSPGFEVPDADADAAAATLAEVSPRRLTDLTTNPR